MVRVVLCTLALGVFGCDGAYALPPWPAVDGGPPEAPAGFVSAWNGRLFLDGQPFRLLGANRYDLASFPAGAGFACGRSYTDDEVEQLVGELAASTGATALRLWAFASFTAGGTDWTTLDRALAAARRHGLKVVFTLENEWADCTEPDPDGKDGRKSGAWFAGGYRRPLGRAALSYRDYVERIVTRYAGEPTVAVWQLLNEAESDDADALAAFAGDVARQVKALDGRHLVSLGTLGSGQAGTAGARYEALHEEPAIDLVEAHDYGRERDPLPGAPDSRADSVYADLAVARRLGKPFLLGEVGIAAPPPDFPFSREERAQLFDSKLAAAFEAGASGFLVWSFYDLRPPRGWDFDGADPLAGVLRRYGSLAP